MNYIEKRPLVLIVDDHRQVLKFIEINLKLHGFACLLDGLAIPGEDRARGARFNSALRFTAVHTNVIIVVVSLDRPISVIQEGVELNAQCEWKPVPGCIKPPPTLEHFIE